MYIGQDHRACCANEPHSLWPALTELCDLPLQSSAWRMCWNTLILFLCKMIRVPPPCLVFPYDGKIIQLAYNLRRISIVAGSICASCKQTWSPSLINSSTNLHFLADFLPEVPPSNAAPKAPAVFHETTFNVWLSLNSDCSDCGPCNSQIPLITPWTCLGFNVWIIPEPIWKSSKFRSHTASSST